MTSLQFDTSQSIKSAAGDYYKVIQVLGEGKSATAYLALKTSSIDRGTFSVIKIMQHPDDSVKLSSFNNEVSVLKRLNHSSIMNLQDEGVFKANGTEYPFYVCDFYTRTLGFLIKGELLSITQKLSVAIQMCSALANLKDHGIIHCDVKPGNIYADGLKCVLADFGLSVSDGATPNDSILPSLHKYRSPDIVDSIRNETPLTSKSDVFQLGLVLSELFTGKNPCVEAKEGSSKVFVDYIEAVHGKFGSRIQGLIEKMLEIDPANRPDAADLIDRWQSILFDAYDYVLEIDKNVF